MTVGKAKPLGHLSVQFSAVLLHMEPLSLAGKGVYLRILRTSSLAKRLAGSLAGALVGSAGAVDPLEALGAAALSHVPGRHVFCSLAAVTVAMYVPFTSMQLCGETTKTDKGLDARPEKVGATGG